MKKEKLAFLFFHFRVHKSSRVLPLTLLHMISVKHRFFVLFAHETILFFRRTSNHSLTFL